MSAKKKLVTDMDMSRLSVVLENDDMDASTAIQLDEALGSVSVVDATKVPGDLVTMNTKIRVSGDEVLKPVLRLLTLVYPRSADIASGKIAVTTPLGTKLLGARAGDEVAWSGPDGNVRRMLITEIVYQPEAAGDWHL